MLGSTFGVHTQHCPGDLYTGIAGIMNNNIPQSGLVASNKERTVEEKIITQVFKDLG